MTFNLTVSVNDVRNVTIVKGGRPNVRITGGKDFDQKKEFDIKEEKDGLSVIQKTKSGGNGRNNTIISNINCSGSVIINGVSINGNSMNGSFSECETDIVIDIPDDMNVRLSFSGNADVDVCKVAGGSVTVTGNATVVMEGFTEPSILSVTGNGKIKVLNADNVNGTVTGNGDISAKNVNGYVHASVTGNGTVKMAGNISDVFANVTGNGDIVLTGVTGKVHKSVTGNGSVSIR